MRRPLAFVTSQMIPPHNQRLQYAAHIKLSKGQHLPPTALAILCSLNDARQIQQLDLRTSIPHHSGHARQRRKFVRGHLITTVA